MHACFLEIFYIFEAWFKTVGASLVYEVEEVIKCFPKTFTLLCKQVASVLLKSTRT